ncbi:fatty acid synthase [Trichonephila clavata]|uniref:Fatty acid synthase n=1 Tax=Trichonephila clavata TaxID=2740835 RepID=A0A8X6FSH8_TRICU|nr:fatty acid synthase [Trichonephila clavata]
MSKRKENFQLECVPVHQNKYAQKVTSGGVELKNLSVEFAPRHAIKQIPLLEEYHFVPYHEENILSKSNKKTLIKYIDVCSSIAKMTLELLGKNGDEISSILKGSQLADYLSTTSYLESQADSHILLKSLCAIMDAVTDTDFTRHVESYVDRYLLERDLDVLSKTLVQEIPLRGVLDIVLENIVPKKLKVAEVSNSSQPLCAKIIEVIQTNCLSANYSVAHSSLDLLDRGCLPSEMVDVFSWVPGSSLSFKDIDLFVMKYLNSSKEDHARLLRAASATIKDGGFIIVLEKTRLVPAEMFLSTIRKTTLPMLSEPDLEQTFKELKLRVICKKSDSLTSTLYLLRKVPVASYQDAVIPIEVGKYEKWVTELKEQIVEVISQPIKSKRIWLVSEGTNCSGVIGLVNCLRLEPGGSSIRCVFISEEVSTLPKFNTQTQFYEEILAKDLTMNIFKTNSWGSYRHFEMSEGTQSIEMEHAYLNLLTRGNLSSLTWIDSPLKYVTQSSDTLLCHVYYAPLNFKDVMLATGKLSQSE